jgi:hypothetical protein
MLLECNTISSDGIYHVFMHSYSFLSLNATNMGTSPISEVLVTLERQYGSKTICSDIYTEIHNVS